MVTYNAVTDFVKSLQDLGFSVDPEILSFLLKEIRCRDKRLEALKFEIEALRDEIEATNLKGVRR